MASHWWFNQGYKIAARIEWLKEISVAELFTSFSLKEVTLRNRIVVPPMCQYSAVDGVANDWHKTHYSAMSYGGAGLIVVEATAVSPEGRITPNCLGIWNDEQAAKLKEISSAIKVGGAIPGIQIAHAGRKANAQRPWDGDDHIPAGDSRYWEIIGPSAVAFGGKLPRAPKEMTLDDIARVKSDFVKAAKRALDAGFEWIELHFAHGYLAQSFFSKHSNKRTDQYGGSFENRSRFLTETLQAVREVWPAKFPLTVRFGVLEFDGHDDETLRESIELVKVWKESGLDLLSVSMAFNNPEAKIPWGPAFMGPIAKRVRDETALPVTSAWGFGVPDLAEKAVQEKQLDIVSVGKAHLANPHWTYFAAKELGQSEPQKVFPSPYAYWLERY